jgi:hypothetical protein
MDNVGYVNKTIIHGNSIGVLFKKIETLILGTLRKSNGWEYYIFLV